MAKPTTPSGFRDFLPAQYRRRQELIRRIRESYESFGFEGMDTPAMENLAVFLGKGGGENEKVMFRVLKRGAELERARVGGNELSPTWRCASTSPCLWHATTPRIAATCPPSSSGTRSVRCGERSAPSTAATGSSRSVTSTCSAPRPWPWRRRGSSPRRRRWHASASPGLWMQAPGLGYSTA
jgi:hypothetical protein